MSIIEFVLLGLLIILAVLIVIRMVLFIIYAIVCDKTEKKIGKFVKDTHEREKNKVAAGNANTCISCGAIIPEGGWTCPNCENS